MSSPNVRVVNQKGEHGGLYITDTAAHTGVWDAIQALETAEATLVSTNLSGTLTSVPIPAGVTIFGHFSSITLAAGIVIAYNATEKAGRT
jgi:hypothetical protein